MIFLRQFLNGHDIDFYAIELFGKGSPYSFDSDTSKVEWWSCLFPNDTADELLKEEIADKLFQALNGIKPDIVISSSIVFYAGALGIRWAKNNKKKFVMFDDAKPWQVKRNVIVQGVKDMITKQADAFWLPSADYNIAYNRLKKKDTLFIYGYNCIDNDLFKGRDINELKNGKIVCVARLVPIKNIDNLLRAWQLVEKHNTQYKLVIAGDGPERKKLLDLSEKLDLHNVVFAGAVSNNDIPNYYHNADALILPSLSETWGLVVNEAMAAGLPVLLSNKVNACASLLKESVNGFSFEPTDVNEMALAISSYLDLENGIKRKMANESLAIIAHMSYANMGKQLIEALYSIISVEFKAPGFIARVLINNWYGRYNTSGWDKL